MFRTPGVSCRTMRSVARSHRPRPPRVAIHTLPAASSSDVPDEAVGEGGEVGRVVPVDLEGGAVVAVEPVLGGQPDVAAPVLEHVHHRGLGEPLLEGEALEADRADEGGRGRRRQRERRPGPAGRGRRSFASFRFHVFRSHERVMTRGVVPMPLRSSSANASAGTAGENRKPWYSLHP